MEFDLRSMREKDVSTFSYSIFSMLEILSKSWNRSRIEITVWDDDPGPDQDDILGWLVIDIRTLPASADVWFDLIPKNKTPESKQTSPGKIHLLIELDGENDREIPIYDQENVFINNVHVNVSIEFFKSDAGHWGAVFFAHPRFIFARYRSIWN